MIDWDLAVSAASRMAGPGPSITRAEADAVVAELRGGAERSTPLVREFTGLTAHERTAPVLVVDRPGWIQANADGFADVHRAARREAAGQARAAARRSPRRSAPGSPASRSARLLGFMSSKVLGQFDPFYRRRPDGDGRRRPAAAGRAQHRARRARARRRPAPTSGCGCACTRRPTGCSSPPCRGCATTSAAEIDAARRRRSTSTPAKVAAMLGEAVKRVGDVVRGDDDASLARPVLHARQQREVIDRLTGVMSLLEGHADVVMDGVGPEVIPTVADDPRASSTSAARAPATLDRLLRRLLGLDAKMAQYRDGAAFVRGVVDQVGMDGFNAVWAEPANLPTKAEIGDPRGLGPPRARLSRRRMALDPAVAGGPARRTPRRSPTSAPRPGAGRLLRRRRLAGAARGHRLRGARAGAGTSSAVTVDHGLQDGLGRAGRPGRRADGRARRRRDRRRSRVRGRAAAGGPGGGGPRGPVRRARRGRRSASGRRRRAARAHPRRPGRDRAARAGPRLGRAVAGRDAPRLRRASAGRCSTSPARQTEAACRARGHRVVGRPAQRATRGSPGRGSGTRVLPVLEDELGPGVAEALARTADLLRDDADALDALADRALRADVADATVPRTLGARTRPTRPSRSGCCGWRPLDAGCPAAELFRVHVAGARRARRRRPARTAAGRAARPRHARTARATSYGSAATRLWQADAMDETHVEGDLVNDPLHRGADPAAAAASWPPRSRRTTRARTSCSSACSRAR